MDNFQHLFCEISQGDSNLERVEGWLKCPYLVLTESRIRYSGFSLTKIRLNVFSD